MTQRLVGVLESTALLSLPHIPLIVFGNDGATPVSTPAIFQFWSTWVHVLQNPHSACPSFAFQDAGVTVIVFPFFVFVADQILISPGISKDILQLVIGVVVVFLRTTFRQYPLFQSAVTLATSESPFVLSVTTPGRADDTGGVVGTGVVLPTRPGLVGRPDHWAQYPTSVDHPGAIFWFQFSDFTVYESSIWETLPPQRPVIIALLRTKLNSDQDTSAVHVFLREIFSQKPIPQSDVIDCDATILSANTKWGIQMYTIVRKIERKRIYV